VLVGPYPPCTQTSATATGIFEGGVGNPTSGCLDEDDEFDNDLMFATDFMVIVDGSITRDSGIGGGKIAPIYI